MLPSHLFVIKHIKSLSIQSTDSDLIALLDKIRQECKNVIVQSESIDLEDGSESDYSASEGANFEEEVDNIMDEVFGDFQM